LGVGLRAACTMGYLACPAARPPPPRRLPTGLAYAIHPRSAKNAGKGPGYPARLTLLELAGMLRGPLAYGLARRTS
jgi:hypothetical protein